MYTFGKSEIKVSQVNVYPIKSCGPLQQDSAEIGELGLKHDRSFMLIGERGQMITQRTHPKLALVETALSSMGGESLEVTAPGFETISFSTYNQTESPEVEIDLFKKIGTGSVVPEASAYFSEYLQKAVRLARIKIPRTINQRYHQDDAVTQTAFADGFPILFATEESMAELNLQLDESVSIDRFRANIVVEGAPAYDEDFWREVRIGNLRAFVVRACARCPMPNVDQSVGELAGQRLVTEALRAHRSGVDLSNDSKGEFFGQNVSHIYKPGQTVRVGDIVEVIERSDERNVVLS